MSVQLRGELVLESINAILRYLVIDNELHWAIFYRDSKRMLEFERESGKYLFDKEDVTVQDIEFAISKVIAVYLI